MSKMLTGFKKEIRNNRHEILDLEKPEEIMWKELEIVRAAIAGVGIPREAGSGISYTVAANRCVHLHPLIPKV